MSDPVTRYTAHWSDLHAIAPAEGETAVVLASAYATLEQERDRLRGEVEGLRAIMTGPVTNTPEMVANYFVVGEETYHPESRLALGANIRLAEVIRRARLDGAATLQRDLAAVREALEFTSEYRHEGCVPFKATTDLETQESEWWCRGCSGKFLSAYPEWPQPTDKTFPHESGCRYMVFLNAAHPQPASGEEAT